MEKARQSNIAAAKDSSKPNVVVQKKSEIATNAQPGFKELMDSSPFLGWKIGALVTLFLAVVIGGYSQGAYSRHFNDITNYNVISGIFLAVIIIGFLVAIGIIVLTFMKDVSIIPYQRIDFLLHLVIGSVLLLGSIFILVLIIEAESKLGNGWVGQGCRTWRTEPAYRQVARYAALLITLIAAILYLVVAYRIWRKMKGSMKVGTGEGMEEVKAGGQQKKSKEEVGKPKKSKKSMAPIGTLAPGAPGAEDPNKLKLSSNAPSQASSKMSKKAAKK